MITINLLPPLKKQELRLRGLYVAIKNLMYTVLLLTILSTIVLLATKALLQNHFNQTVAESTLTLKSGKIFNNDIRIFNQQLYLLRRACPRRAERGDARDAADH